MARDLFPSQAPPQMNPPLWGEHSPDCRDQDPEYRLIHQMSRPIVRRVSFIHSFLARWTLVHTGGKRKSRARR